PVAEFHAIGHSSRPMAVAGAHCSVRLKGAADYVARLGVWRCPDSIQLRSGPPGGADAPPPTRADRLDLRARRASSRQSSSPSPSMRTDPSSAIASDYFG